MGQSRKLPVPAVNAGSKHVREGWPEVVDSQV